MFLTALVHSIAALIKVLATLHNSRTDLNTFALDLTKSIAPLASSFMDVDYAGVNPSYVLRES